MKLLSITVELRGHPITISSEHIIGKLFARSEHLELLEFHLHLTAKEKEVAQMLKVGATRAEISSKLHISKTTAITHTRSIMQKLGVSKRAQIPLALKSADLEEGEE